jgi:hypothetical protein
MRTTATRVFVFCLLVAILVTPTLLAADATPSPSNRAVDWITAVINFLTVQAEHVLSIPQG